MMKKLITLEFLIAIIITYLPQVQNVDFTMVYIVWQLPIMLLSCNNS